MQACCHAALLRCLADEVCTHLSSDVQGSEDAVGLDVKVAVSAKGQEVGASVGRVGRAFLVSSHVGSRARLWSADASGDWCMA